MLYGELKGLELFDPSGDLSFRLFKGHEPLQSSMISANGEGKAAEDVLEMVYCINQCQQFHARDTIVPLRLIQGTTVVSNNPFSVRSTAPRPVLLVSVSRINGNSVFGATSTGSLHKACFSSWKAALCCGPHSYGVSLCIKTNMGAATVENPA